MNWCERKQGYCQCLEYIQERVPPTCIAWYCPLRDIGKTKEEVLSEINKNNKYIKL